MKTMHLFAGAGGGILADLILGHEPTVAVEWDAYCCQVLRERVADGWFPGMQVWEGDVRLFDPSEYKGRVDCIHAGFPCQDISTAGNQAGVGEDTRSGLYTETLRIADVVRPGYIFLENVAAIVSGADGEWLRTIVSDLAERGHDAVWCCLSAAEVGAPHKRDRWWLLGYPKHDGQPATKIKSGPTSGNDCGEAGKKQARKPSGSGEQHDNVADTNKLNGDDRGYGAGEIRREQSGQAEIRGCERCGWWQAESEVGRVVNGMAYRSHQLKALGNGQVPLQAATAFSILWQMMEAANES